MRFSIRTILELLFVIAVALTVWRAYHAPGIARGELIHVSVSGVLPDQPIDGFYRVEEDGRVTLGPAYGTVSVAWLSSDAAAQAITRRLAQVVRAPEVAVSRTGGDATLVVQAENETLNDLVEELKFRLAEYEEPPYEAPVIIQKLPVLRIDRTRSVPYYRDLIK